MKFRIVKVIFITISVFLLFLLISVGSLAIYAKNFVSFDTDESLFAEAKEEKRIRFYYDATGEEKLESYSPVLYEEVNLSDKRREWYSYGEFSQMLRDGFLAMEDRDFFTHHGIDLKRTFAAALNYIFGGNDSFGGSTLTQQVIKNISGDNEKTVKRKLDEIIRAYHLEYAHSKEEIFELYLNIIPMSNNVYGIGLAAESYFGKAPSELNAAECATLIAVANAPSRYNPYKNVDLCTEKRNKVLYVMHEQGVIDYDTYIDAKNTPIVLKNGGNTSDNIRSWFSETVISEVISDLTKERNCSYEAARLLLYKNGAEIYTTVDPIIQNTLEEYFENSDNFPEEIKNGLEYSMVICDTESGKLRAVVGGVGKKKSNRAYNNALMLHTPGSVIKPLALYLPLIDEGKISWSTVFDDVPVTFSQNANGEYIEYPKNYPPKYEGLTTVADALRKSKNTVAVRLYNMLGAEKIYNYLSENFEFDSLVYSESGVRGKITDLAPSPLALGQLSKGVSLRKLTEAYTVFGREGRCSEGCSYIAAFDCEGNSIIKKERIEKQVCTPESARLMTQLLSLVVESGTASKITLGDVYDTAGKTGTSGNDMDRLFVGYTPYYTAGVWCGYADRSSAVGGHEKNHFTVWDGVMKLVHEKKVGYSEYEKHFSTEGLLYAPFCRDSGKLLTRECLYDPRGDRLDFGYFIKGTEPQEECDRHILLYEKSFPFISKISLLKIDERNFPKIIEVTDEKYAYRIRKKANMQLYKYRNMC